MILRGAWYVMAKEVVDNLRDRRSIMMSAVYPVIGPIILGLLLGFTQDMFKPTSGPKRTQKIIEAPFQGVENAPGLQEYLTKSGVRVTKAPDDVRTAVRENRLPFAVVVPKEFQEVYDAEQRAQIELVVNANRLGTIVDSSKVVGKLARMGIDKESLEAVKIDTVNVGQVRSLAAFFLHMIPPFVIFTIFVGGVYLALDTTSGERERGSLEPLLVNPLARWEFMLGKSGAAMVYTMAAVIIQLVSFKIVFMIVLEKGSGVVVDTSVMLFVKIFLISLPIMIMAVAMQVIVASMTKSFKETQTYLGLLPLVPSAPGMVLVFVSVTVTFGVMLIPFFSQVVIIGQYVRGYDVPMEHVAVASLSTLLLSGVLLYIAARLYSREQLLFTA
jgi:sodium transport system permease protein